MAWWTRERPSQRLADWGFSTSDAALVFAVGLDDPVTAQGAPLAQVLAQDLRLEAYGAVARTDERLYAWINGVPTPEAPDRVRAPPLPGLQAYWLDGWHHEGRQVIVGGELFSVIEQQAVASAFAWDVLQGADEVQQRFAAIGAPAARPGFYVLRRRKGGFTRWEQATTTN